MVYYYYYYYYCAGLHCSEIQEGLCDAVNNLVKHFYKPEKEVSHKPVLMSLLCTICHDFYHSWLHQQV